MAIQHDITERKKLEVELITSKNKLQQILQLSDLVKFAKMTPIEVENEFTLQNAFDFVIAQLDDYEGLVQEEDEETLYIRTLTDVYVNDKIHSKAYVYWSCGDVTYKQIITSGDVLAYFEQKTKGL